MQAVILVAYASRNGSTAEVAEFIAQVLDHACGPVELAPIQRVHTVRRYRAVVLGSAVRYQHWLPEAVAFLSAERNALRIRLAACFTMCGLLRWETPANYSTALQSFGEARNRVTEIHPMSVGVFAGSVSPGASLSQKQLNSLEPGDWRNWSAIRTWSLDVAAIIRESFMSTVVPKAAVCAL